MTEKNGGNFMGHAIIHYEFDINTDKRRIESEMNEIAREDGDYHSGLNCSIRWLDHICEDRERAYEYINSHDKGWYDQLAVKFREYPKYEPTKALLKLKERVSKEHEKRDAYEKAHSVSSFKIEYIGCPKCGSKLKRTLLRRNSCPLCGTELRSKTTMETLQRYSDNIEKLNALIKEEERKINKKNIKKSKIKWLVKIEYHV